jgi:glycosyltransferase involved in cell wall biosynthesis
LRPIFFSESSPNIGGQELQLLQQAQGLGAQGWTPRILCRAGSRIAQEALARGLAVEPVRFRSALDGANLGRVIALVRRDRPAAIVCHSGHDANVCALAVHAASLFGLLQPRPRLVRMRTYQPGKAGAFGYNHLFDASFTPSAALRAQLLRNPKIRPGRIGVLYPGIDFEQVRRAAQAPLPEALAQRLAQAPGPVIVHAAMLRPEKGHAFLLEVVQALLPRFPGLLYVAAGEGVELERLREETRQRGLEPHVHFAGMLQPVAPLIRRADVLVMPSLYEPLGMSQVEALSLGVPVVVSNVGGLPETVRHGETGLLCPAPDRPGALAAWTTALTLLIADSQAARAMAQRGREQVLAQFDPAANLAALVRAIG